MEELSELREFYDPDTVELMTWIRYTHTSTLTNPEHTSNRSKSDLLDSSDQVSLCLMSLISLRVCLCVYLCIGACLPGSVSDGSPRIRLGGAGMDPAVGRALTHLWASAAGLSIKSITTMGLEMVL